MTAMVVVFMVGMVKVTLRNHGDCLDGNPPPNKMEKINVTDNPTSHLLQLAQSLVVITTIAVPQHSRYQIYVHDSSVILGF